MQKQIKFQKMKIIDNKRVFLFIMLLLTLVNIGFVVTVIMESRNQPKTEFQHRKNTGKGNRFMESEIGFSSQQMEVFQRSRKEFRQEMSPIFGELRDLNKQLVIEATSNEPDSLNAARLTRLIGDKHREIKQITYKHFEEVSKGATPEQKMKLREFYFNLFDDGKHMRHNRGRHNF